MHIKEGGRQIQKKNKRERVRGGTNQDACGNPRGRQSVTDQSSDTEAKPPAPNAKYIAMEKQSTMGCLCPLAESWGCRLRDSSPTPTLFAPSKPRDVTTESGSVCALCVCALCKPSGLHPARLEPRSIRDELGELKLACVSSLSPLF